jgi:hypothetical protein
MQFASVDTNPTKSEVSAGSTLTRLSATNGRIGLVKGNASRWFQDKYGVPGIPGRWLDNPEMVAHAWLQSWGIRQPIGEAQEPH